jgi:DNA-directed RNA polymerase subunit M/transcription elongation factor TFIIS
MSSVLILTQKAEVKTAKLPNTVVTIKDIQKYFKKKTEPEVLGTYNYKTFVLFLIGYTNGKAGTENKHEFPPPHDTILAFGDIMLIASKDENSFSNPVAFKPEDYETFYSKAFGGFEDLDSDDEDDDDDDFIEEEVETNEVFDNDDIEAAEEDNYDNQSYVSEESVEIVVKKERKKKVPITIQQVNIHPDKQLKVDSEKNSLRVNIIEKLKKLFDKELSSSEVNQLEQEIYEASLVQASSKHIVKDWSVKLFEHIYMCILRKTVGNLCPKTYVKNTELINRYKSKKITLKDIASMSYYNLNESKWRDRIEHQKDIEKRHLEGNKSMATDQFLCSRCHKRECTYYEMQTRSADEPMTIFISCLNCGKNWRQ